MVGFVEARERRFVPEPKPISNTREVEGFKSTLAPKVEGRGRRRAGESRCIAFFWDLDTTAFLVLYHLGFFRLYAEAAEDDGGARGGLAGKSSHRSYPSRELREDEETGGCSEGYATVRVRVYCVHHQQK